MTTASVNDSGDTVQHADGNNGEINSIYFDLSTNASGGAVVHVLSLNEQLTEPGANFIPDVASGAETQITARSNLYGINSYSGLTNTVVAGTVNIHDDCDGDSGNNYYCDVSDGGTPIELFNTNNGPLDTLRLEWEVGASPGALSGTGRYSDELTFIASALF